METTLLQDALNTGGQAAPAVAVLIYAIWDIRKKIAGVKNQTKEDFSAVHERMDKRRDAQTDMDKRIALMENQVNNHISGCQAQYDRVDGRFDKVEERLTKMDEHISAIASKLDKISGQIVANQK